MTISIIVTVVVLVKKKVVCPFSGRPCKNCAVYLGRHYYLCSSTNYRGFLGRAKATDKAVARRPFSGKTKKVKVPIVKTGALDPFDADL